MVAAVLPVVVKFLLSYYKVPRLASITGLSASTLNRYKKLTSFPTPASYKKMYNAYRSTTYTALRYAGASRNEANRFKGASPTKVFDIVKKYNDTVSRLAKNYGVTEDKITQGMAQSEKDSEEIFQSV